MFTRKIKQIIVAFLVKKAVDLAVKSIRKRGKF